MKLVLTKDRTTKRAVRFADGEGHNIYLSKDEAKKLNGGKTPESLRVAITVA